MDAMPYFEKGLTLDPKTPERPFFQQIIDRAKKEKAGLIKPGSSGRPHLSPAAPDQPGSLKGPASSAPAGGEAKP